MFFIIEPKVKVWLSYEEGSLNLRKNYFAFIASIGLILTARRAGK